MNWIIKLCLALLLISQTACKDSLTGELFQQTDSSLQLYEGSQGILAEVSQGSMTVSIPSEVDLVKNFITGNKTLRLTLNQGGNQFYIDIEPKNFDLDGSFYLSEVDIAQPIRVEGQLITKNETEKTYLDIKIYKGFSNSKEPLWRFRSEPFESQLINNIKRERQLVTQAAL